MELACSTLRDSNNDRVIRECYTTCMGLDDCIVDALIDGDLPAKYADHSSDQYQLERKYRERARASGHPGYYMNALTDDQGRSPPCQVLSDALDLFSMYCNPDRRMSLRDRRIVNRIDRQMAPFVSRQQTETGFRKYLFDEHDERPIQRRYEACNTFSRNLARALSAIPKARWNLPFIEFLVEFGFSVKLIERMDEHARHEKSNCIMNLFEACLRQANGTKYTFKQYVVALCDMQEHAQLGEIMITRLGQGYITSGSGLSHYPAGRSPYFRWPHDESVDFQWFERNAPLWENHKRELARIEENAKAKRIKLRQSLPVDKVLISLYAVRIHVKQ